MQKKVMVIDDSRVTLHHVGVALRKAGFRVTTREFATGASGTIFRDQPDLIIVDINMPAISGPELIHILRRQRTLRNARILLYSSTPEPELKLLSESCCADAYVCKERDTTKLVRIAWRLLGENRFGGQQSHPHT